MNLTDDQLIDLWRQACETERKMAAFYEVDLDLLRRFYALAKNHINVGPPEMSLEELRCHRERYAAKHPEDHHTLNLVDGWIKVRESEKS